LLHCSIVILSLKIEKITILANFFKKPPFLYTTYKLVMQQVASQKKVSST